MQTGSNGLVLTLVTLAVFGPIAGIVLANWLRDLRFARQERKRLAAGGEVFDEVPAGLDLRNSTKRLARLRPDSPEPDRYTWTERRPNEPARPEKLDLRN